ncbi:MAG TPA: hypothetical protein VGP48_05710 [Stellaceae bacterium]|nr:hypothetical protein [Stellaceae bacterium]
MFTSNHHKGNLSTTVRAIGLMMAVGLVGSALASPARATTHLQLPQGVAVDTAGNIYVADAPGGSGSVFIYNVK